MRSVYGMETSLVRRLAPAFLLLCMLFATLRSNAATYYVSPTGSNLRGDGSANKPWQTISHATGKMTAGDVLILKDGVYSNSKLENAISPPSGTPEHYTVVKAENDWKAIIDGQGFRAFSSYPVHIRNKSYIQVEGIKIRNGTSDVAVEIAHSSYIKILRTSIKSGVSAEATYGIAISIGGACHHILVEDTWITGSMANGVMIFGADTGGPNKVILRRVVVRWDYMNTNQPLAGFTVNGQTEQPNTRDILLQNDISLDFNDHGRASNPQDAFSSDRIWQNIQYYGNIALNLGPPWLGFAGAGYGGSGNKSYANDVAWGVNTAFRASGSTPSFSQAIAGNSAVGFVAYGDGTYKNSLFINNANPNVGGSASYNDFSSSGIVPPGTGNRTNDPKLQFLVRTTDTGTGESGAKRGATIEKRYGISGTLWDEPGFDQLSSESLWPWPFEDQIKADFAEKDDPPKGAFPAVNNTKRGFAADGKGLYGGPITLTSYIWEALGNPCPAEICKGATFSEDKVPPAILIASPATEAKVSGIVTVTATATDNVSVVGVQFLINNKPLGAEVTTVPYSVVWDTTRVEEGPYTLSARVRDAAGNTAVATSVQVTVTKPKANNP